MSRAERKRRPPGERVHGTAWGYRQHVRYREVPCGWCNRANADTARAQRNKGRCAPGLGWPLEASRG